MINLYFTFNDNSSLALEINTASKNNYNFSLDSIFGDSNTMLTITNSDISDTTLNDFWKQLKSKDSNKIIKINYNINDILVGEIANILKVDFNRYYDSSTFEEQISIGY